MGGPASRADGGAARVAEPCPCGSGDALAACCGPALTGRVLAPTALALMRSRYTAHVRGAERYLRDTHAPPDGGQPPTGSTAPRVRWTGLEILACEAGGAADESGTVEFRALYTRPATGERGVHHERSRFARSDGRWVYVDGDLVGAAPARSASRPGRNAPCPCGSDRKYKRCCGAA